MKTYIYKILDETTATVSVFYTDRAVARGAMKALQKTLPGHRYRRIVAGCF